ncbi:hypothetical protein VaNZ11_013721 [Volvox africanus]|uniref:1,3-beta-glucan synthase n=1 Tax=Volvox africanus TaxID=51714 RepID=A0ABQ5SJ55_9CHLO|nr:hypothetical protein VaNZ11_013721 [Volvox africanus]
MQLEPGVAGWLPSAGEGPLAEGTPSARKTSRNGLRECLLRIGQDDDTEDSTTQLSMDESEAPGRAAGGWRSSVLAHSKACRPADAADSPDAVPDVPIASITPSQANGSPSRLQKRTTSGLDADRSGTSGPSIVEGRLTANGILTAARQPAANMGALPQPQRLRDSAPGALGSQSIQAAQEAPEPVDDLTVEVITEPSTGAFVNAGMEAVMAEDVMARGSGDRDPSSPPPKGSFVSPLLSGKSSLALRLIQNDEDSGKDSSAVADVPVRMGWRTAVGALSRGGEQTLDHLNISEPGNAPAAAAAPQPQSLWRNITKSFAGQLQDADADTSTPGWSDRLSRSALSFPSSRAPASLPHHSDKPADGVVITPGALSSPQKPESPKATSDGDGDATRMSRIEAAAARAVREADVEAVESKRSGTFSDGGASPSKSGSRRLRFTSAKPSSAQSTFGAGSGTPNSQGSRYGVRAQSFRDRVANALGLGGLVGSRSHDGGTPRTDEEDVSPSSAQGAVHSVLKKEGTSKQLRLAFAAGDGDDETGGISPSKQKIATGDSHRELKLEAPDASETAAAGTTSFKGPGAGVGLSYVLSSARPDSAVVPGHLHLSSSQMDVQVHDLEETLLSPSALLPPGESLPPPMPRQVALLAKSSDVAPVAAATVSSQQRLEALRGLSMKTRSAASEASGASTAVATNGTNTATAMTPTAAMAAAITQSASNVAQPSVPETPSAPAPVPTIVKARSTIKLPIITTGHWESLVFATVWRVGRVFGFQAFNIRPSTQNDAKREYVPAAIFAAADHLIQLLVKNGYVRRHRGDDTDEERFAKALFEFHSTIFYSYEMQWIKMQQLSPRAQRFTDELREKVFSEHYVINGLLCELALYFLIFTEAANLRFCSEAMWMIFWCMNHSYVMADLWNRGSPDRVPNGRDRLPQLRNTFQHLIKELQLQICIRPADMRPEDCGKMSSILSRLANSADVPLSDRELLADLVCYGDGGFFMDRVITPIFYVMSYEIDHLSTLGVDTAHRLGYDDFNESLTCRDIVYNALLELRVTPQDIANGATNDAYHSLTSLGFQGRTVINNKFDPQVAAEWWRLRVFVKTYRERRSWWGVYRAFFRVYAFHFVLFHLMQAQAFAAWDWRVASSAIITHAWLTWLERVANWMMTMPSPEPLQTTMTKIFDRKGFYKLDQVLALMQHTKGQRYRGGIAALNNGERLKLMKAHQTRSANDLAAPTQRLTIKQLRAMQPERILMIEGTPLYGLFGGLTEWLFIAIALTSLYVLQFFNTNLRPYAYDNWGYVAAGYTGLHVLHFILTTRDGYAISLTEALHLPEYFQNWSSRPRPRTWMYNDMHIKWKNYFVNLFFWLLVFAMKIPFDYFVIHTPLVKPLRLLLTRNWMGCKGDWYRFPGGVRIPCIGGDWILVAARVFPFIIVALFDTALFYQFIVTAFGIYHGLIKLDLGVVSTWEDLVREFHKSPPRWWIRCMSFTGNENQKNLLFQTISANAQAAADADETGGPGEDVKKNVAISDGLMFKIKIVTPEEIKAKQGLMLKERKINMQAGKAGSSNEVEGKAVKAVQDKVSAAAPGAAGAPARPGGAVLNLTNSIKSTGANSTTAALPGGKPDTRSVPGPGGLTASGGGGAAPKPVPDAAAKGPSYRQMISVNGRTGVPLVGQDFKDAQTRPQGLGGLFGWRGSENPGTAPPGMVQLPGMVPLPGARSNYLAPAASAGTLAGTAGVGATPSVASLFGARRGSVGEDGTTSGSGGSGLITGKMKALATSGLAAAMLTRKANQVQPEPVAEGTEDRCKAGGPEPYDLASTAAAAVAPSDFRTRFRTSMLRLEGAPSSRHPAWQPEDLLGPGHRDYDAANDPMSPNNARKQSDEGRTLAYRIWQFWSGRQGRGEERALGPGLVSGPALASLRVHGWRPEGEIEAWREDAVQDGEQLTRQQPPQQQQEDERRKYAESVSSYRVYHGALGEGVTLVGPDGRPLPKDRQGDGGEDEESGPRRPAPLVLLSEVPIIRIDSESSNNSQRESLDRPSGRGAFSKEGKPMEGKRKSIEFREPAQAAYRAGAAEDSDDEAVRSGRPAGMVKFTRRSASTSRDLEDNNSPRNPRGQSKPAKASPSSQSKRRGGFFSSLFRSKSGDQEGPGKDGGKDGSDEDEEDEDEEEGEGDRTTPELQRSKDFFGRSNTDSSLNGKREVSFHFKRAEASVSGGSGAWREAEQSVRGGGGVGISRRWDDASSTRGRGGGPSRRPGDMSVRGGAPSRRSMEISVRGGAASRRSMDSSVLGGRGAVGPAAAGFGVQRQRSITGAAGLNRRASFASPANLQRMRSISAAASTNFEQKQFAKKYERQHSMAAQVVKRDLATRTTSMVLMGTEELQNMEDDDLDVVSEQMMMWSSFAEAWDAVCDDLREGDLISDKEMSLLKFVRLESSGKLYGLRPILLPTFFFAGQIRKVVDTGRVNTAQVMVLTEFRVLITWLACQLGIMSGKHAHVIMTASLYGGIINVKHINLRKKSFDSAIAIVGLVDSAIRTREVPFEIQAFAEHLLTILNGLESECYAVQKMWELGRVSDDELDGALTLFEVVQDMQERVRSDPEELKQCLKRAVAMEDLTTNTNVLMQVTTVLQQMLTTTSADATPQGEEAQRVLGFFINSLGHPSLDKPQSVEFMLSWSVLTPVYEEDVLYAVDAKLTAEELGLKYKKITDLLSETDDGFSLMAYLRAMFSFEWSNFKERMRRLVGKQVDIPDWGEVTELDFGPGGLLFDYRTELQLWASYRGQLLARTVRGMMCYERALKVICRMEYPTPMGITDDDYNRWVDAMVGSKFEYVIAVQTYGRNARSNDLRLRQLSQSVDTLLQRFPTLKVAYLDDAVDQERYGPTQYSVLIRNRKVSDPVVDPTRPFSKIAEAYRIRLPYNKYSHRGVVLGEGKPENQNHASVFAFNEGLQAIDMNQDNYLAEALKMRNLLSELNPSNKGAQFLLFADDTPQQVLNPHMTAAELRFVILSRMKRSFPTALVGFREWIFSAHTGALGQYAAATEYSFATIQSRIMTKPPRVRMHYGHPDVFNKTHIMTRGGMSKGTRTLHISEDYFIGAAHTLRGARIRYKEYISCGKGRDMGFDSILGYQKKISGGAGDLATSREVHRLGTRLEFFRLMSFYHGGIGHFLNSYLTLKAAWYNIWALLLTAMAQAMELGIKGDKGQVTLTQTYNVQQVLQLGTLSIIPYVGQLILETGLLRTAITVFGQIVTGSLFFYIFQQQTVAASFSTVMAFGGMRYIGTGRGFSIQTTDFIKMYTMYARTHLYLGFEVLFFCVTLYALNDCVTCNYAALTWNSWLLAFVMILCPLWFNPFIFNLSKVQRDYMAWKRWLGGDVDGGTGTNWFTWNREQLAKPRNDDGNVTDAWRNAFREIVGTCLPYLLLVLATVSRIGFRIDGGKLLDSPYIEFLVATALLWAVVLSLSYLGHYLLERAKSKEWRIIRYVMTLTGMVLFVVYMVVLTRFYTGNGLTHLMQVGYANFVILIMLHRAATYLFTQNNTVREFVDAGFYTIDVLVGYAMFGMLVVLSFVGVVNLLQSKLLFNEAFSQSVQTARIKMQVKRGGKQIKRKAKPGLLMTMDEWMRSRPASAASAATSMAPTAAPSAAPSAVTSVAPSAVPSVAPSAFTSAANSGVSSRRNSFTGTNNNGNRNTEVQAMSAAETARSLQPQLSRLGLVTSATDTAAGSGAGTADPLAADVGLRERRLRFG